MLTFGQICSRYYLPFTLLGGLFIQSHVAFADGQADLRNALKQLQAKNPVSVDAHFKLVGRSGDHHDLIEHEGIINLRLEDGIDGLRAIYSPELVAQLQAEELAKVADENVKNSALNAVGQFEYWEWRELLYPAAQLELALARSHFVDEKVDEWNGQQLRRLKFSMPHDKVDKKYRKYIKKYTSTLLVWIDENGVPIASQTTEKGSGRVFIVISFQFENESYNEYQQHAGRLLTVRREVREETSGTTMQSQRHFIATLNPVPLSAVK
jgi:hypothetical protein